MSLKPKQDIAALRIASGDKLKDIAKELKISAATLSNWQKEPCFIAEVNSNREKLLKSSAEKLTSLSSLAMDRLETLIMSDDHKVSFQAIKLVMSANGMIGESDKSFMRYGAWIGPTSPSAVLREQEKKSQFDDFGFVL